VAKLRLEGRPEELEEKGPEIIKAVVERLPATPLTDPILEILEKARPTKEVQLKHPAVRGIHQEMGAFVESQYAAMLREIGKVLDRDPDETRKAYDHSQRYYDADARRYDEVKAALSEHGYTEMDFQIGGDLHGWSVNQLVELYRKLSSMQKKDRLPGGLADKRDPTDFDASDLADGIEVELEHTTDKDLAREIAMDHLAEDPDYYRKLARVEKGLDGEVELPEWVGAVLWELADNETSELEKAKGHKYLARIPTGKAKPKWRYIYDYRGRPSKERGMLKKVSVMRDDEVQAGASFRDKDLGHDGHWHVEKLEGEKYAKKVTIRHDVTGETKTFDRVYEFKRWLEQGHEPSISAEDKKRRTQAAKNAEAAIKGAEKRWSEYTKDRTGAGLQSVTRQLALVRDRGREAGWKTPDWAEAFGVDQELPKSFEALRKEFYGLQDEVLKTMTFEQLNSMEAAQFVGLVDPANIKKCLRLAFLREHIKGYGEKADALREQYKGKTHRDVVHTFSAKEILSGLGKGEITDRKLLNAIGKAGWGPTLTASDLKMVTITVGPYDFEDLSKKRPEFLEALSDFARRRKGILLDFAGKPPPQSAYYGESALTATIQNNVGTDPRPELYAEGYSASAPSLQDLLAGLEKEKVATLKYATDAAQVETSVEHMAERLKAGDDPMVSYKVLVKTPKPKRKTKQQTDHAVESWKALGGREYKTITAPLSLALKTGEEEAMKAASVHQQAHQKRWSKAEKGIKAVLDKVGDLKTRATQHRDDALREAGITDEQISEMAMHTGQESGSGSRWFRGTDSSRAAWKAYAALHPEKDKIAGLWGDKKKAYGAEKVDAVREERAAWKQAFEAKIAGRVLEDIKKAMGHKPDPAKVKAAIYTPTAKEVEASWVMAESTVKGGAKSATPGEHEPYDLDKDPADLQRLLDFISPEVAPAVRIEVHKPHSRAHCTWDNVIRLGKEGRGAGGSSTLWHEYGHAIEHANSGITEAANALRDQRGRTTPKQTMNEAEESDAYKSSEETYKDDWYSYYTGKWYGHMGSTEILSMGTEALLEDPGKFLAVDPEHFAFTVAALTGQFGGRDKNPHESAVKRHEQFEKKQEASK
jgi:hypothetical protein